MIRTLGRRSRTPIASLIALALILGLAGCGDDDPTTPPGNTGPTTYTGVATGSAVSGMLAVTLGDETRATSVSAAGTFTPSGSGAIVLTGTYDDVAHTFAVDGSGWTFSGALTRRLLSGEFTGPGGESGSFSLQEGSTGVVVIIGTFTSTSGASNGRFNFSISGSTVGGLAMAYDGDAPMPLNGTYTATSGAISIAHPNGGAALAVGTFDSDTGVASGTYDDQDANSGNWSGTRQ